MQLKEYIEHQKQTLDEFADTYERRRKSKNLTLFRPEEEWDELFQEHKELTDG